MTAVVVGIFDWYSVLRYSSTPNDSWHIYESRSKLLPSICTQIISQHTHVTYICNRIKFFSVIVCSFLLLSSVQSFIYETFKTNPYQYLNSARIFFRYIQICIPTSMQQFLKMNHIFRLLHRNSS